MILPVPPPDPFRNARRRAMFLLPLVLAGLLFLLLGAIALYGAP